MDFHDLQMEKERVLREEERIAARIIVAGRAKSNEDCSLLLEALGLK